MLRSSRSPSPSSLPLNGLPINTKPTPRYSSRRSAISFFGTAALTGIVFHLLFLGFGGGDAVREVPVLKEWLPPKPSTVTVVQEACPDSLDPIRTHSATLPKPTYHPPPTAGTSTSKGKENAAVAGAEPEESSDNTASIEELRKMVSQTQGFYGRDYSLGLGWNNMRYIIEAAILQAQLLNRTLVLPSFVYARSCEWEINSCAAFATMVNRGDAIGWGEWRDLPIEKQMGWRVPMDTMLDLPHLRKTWPVILVREYLELHGMDPNKEWSNGAWHRTDYLADKPDGSKYTLFNVKNNLYDPDNVVRVDRKEPFIQKGIKEDADSGSIGLKLYSMMTSKNSKNVIDFEDARSAVEGSMKNRNDDKELQQLLEENGWVVLHTYAGALGMDYLKSVVQPIKQVAPLRWVKGWYEDYKDQDTDIVVLEGETHLGRKPGGMRFSSVEARDDFARTVLYGLRPIDVVRNLAEKVAQRMKDRNNGRMWMAGHMRRGDSKPQDGVYAASLNLKKLVYSLQPAVSEALEPLAYATSNVVDAFGTMSQNDKEKAARSIESIISSAEELCLAVTYEIAMDDEFLANLRLYIENTQALAKRLKERQSASFLRRFLHGIEMDDVLHSVQDSFDSSMAAITMHHLRRKDNKTVLAVPTNHGEDQLELMASEVEVTDAAVFQADVGSFWQGVSYARLNDTIAEEDRNAPPDPDHRKKCIVRNFLTNSEGEFFRSVVDFLLVARHPNLPQLHGFYYDDFTAGMVIKLYAVRPFESYLEQYCQDHSAKESILFFLIVLSDLRQLVEFLEDNDILKDRNVVRSMLAGKNLMFDHLERVIVGPTPDSSSLVLGKGVIPAEQQSQPLELIIEAAGSYRPPPPPPGVDDADYWGSPLIQVVDSLRHNAELLSTDWHLASGGFDWREEFLEQFDPPDAYEVEEFATDVDVEDISLGLVSAVAVEKQINTWEQDSDTDSTTFSSRSSGSRSAHKRPKRIPAVLRSSRRKRQELPGNLVPGGIKGRGGYADVRIGEWFPPGSSRSMVVAIKYPRPVGLNDLDEQERLQALLKRLYQEVVTWQYIRHRYVLPILGFLTVPNPCIIAPWCRFGNILHYLSVKKRVNRLHLLAQIAEGLAYLHTRNPPFIHGDLKPDNILINDDEDPVLADFGLAQITRDVLGTGATSGSAKGTPIWMAPELYDEDANISAASDVYAFAFIVIQLYSEKLPFFDILPKGVVQLMLAVMTGVRPKMEDYPVPPYLVDKTTEYEGLWPLLDRWWDQDPGQRPTAEEIQGRLRAKLNRIEA
ncbi:hypothetical protein FS837_006553 [Tulasnella sp. UAMH 9824]|nr:hypothetical protein FS837_006553 [Tulasnella sp. UAMH 9824]